MTSDEIRQAIKDFENTEIPFLKKKIFGAESLVMDSNNENVVNQAKREIATYREQIKNYEEKVRVLKSYL